MLNIVLKVFPAAVQLRPYVVSGYISRINQAQLSASGSAITSTSIFSIDFGTANRLFSLLLFMISLNTSVDCVSFYCIATAFFQLHYSPSRFSIQRKSQCGRI